MQRSVIGLFVGVRVIGLAALCMFLRMYVALPAESERKSKKENRAMTVPYNKYATGRCVGL